MTNNFIFNNFNQKLESDGWKDMRKIYCKYTSLGMRKLYMSTFKTKKERKWSHSLFIILRKDIMLKRLSLYNLTTGILRRKKKELGGEIIFILDVRFA